MENVYGHRKVTEEMKYIANTSTFQIEEPTIVTLGKFDGRHRGHQKLMRTMTSIKKELGYATAIFTFSVSPSVVGRPDRPANKPHRVITTSEERRRNIQRMGMDYLVEYPFTDVTRHMPPEDFIRDILVGQMNAKVMVVGPDCSFGYQGAGNVELLKRLSERYHYRVVVIEKEKDDQRDISSTYIREELDKGHIAKANELLGQPYAIHGEVIHGKHIGGSLLGFPTANLLPPPNKRLPLYGVYISRVLVDGVYRAGITNVGVKPTVEGDNPAGVETYIFGVQGELYGKWIEVQLLEFDRGEEKFPSLAALKARIEKDKELAQAYFASHPEIYLGPEEAAPAEV